MFIQTHYGPFGVTLHSHPILLALTKLPTRGKPRPRTGGQSRDREEGDWEDSRHSPGYLTVLQPILGGSGAPPTCTGADSAPHPPNPLGPFLALA